MAELIMQEEAGTPATPSSTKWKVYFKSDGFYFIDDTGAEFPVIGAPLTWNPTWTNLSVGNGTLTRAYSRIGKLVVGHLELVFGNTTSISGDVSFSAPVTQGAYGAVSAPIGVTRYIAGGAGFSGVVLMPSTTSIALRVVGVGATYASNVALSSTVPGTWTTNDVIQVQFTYFSA